MKDLARAIITACGHDPDDLDSDFDVDAAVTKRRNNEPQELTAEQRLAVELQLTFDDFYTEVYDELRKAIKDELRMEIFQELAALKKELRDSAEPPKPAPPKASEGALGSIDLSDNPLFKRVSTSLERAKSGQEVYTDEDFIETRRVRGISTEEENHLADALSKAKFEYEEESAAEAAMWDRLMEAKYQSSM